MKGEMKNERKVGRKNGRKVGRGLTVFNSATVVMGTPATFIKTYQFSKNECSKTHINIVRTRLVNNVNAVRTRPVRSTVTTN
jgi:hypothetical protein